MWAVHRPNLPCVFSLLNLCCGFFALVLLFMDMKELGLTALLVAFFADFADGYLARHGHEASSFGERLDSLADLVSFGVAPTFFALSVRPDWEVGLTTVTALYLVCGAVRLARYDPTKQMTQFQGLPIPLAGLFLTAFTISSGFLVGFELLPGILGLLMVSHIPFLKVSFVGTQKWMPLCLGALAVTVLCMSGSIAIATLGFAIPYVALNLLLEGVREAMDRLHTIQKTRSASRVTSARL